MKVRGRRASYVVADAPFGRGGHAEIFAVDGDGLVYKRYQQPVTADRQVRQLQRLCDTGQQILTDRRSGHGGEPVTSINWPLDTVAAPAGGIAGIVVPSIPDRFYLAPGRPRTLDFLLLARANPPAARVRVPVLLRLAEILRRLDDDQLVHGDISAKNVVWCAGPQPGAYLIDCDGLHPRSGRSVHPTFTAGWTDPRLVDGRIGAHDHHSDRYGLALAMYRGLLLNPGNLAKRNGRWPTPASLPAGLDPAIRELILRGLTPLDGDRRPAPADWVQTLTACYLTAGAWDTRRLDVLDQHAHHNRRALTATPTPDTRQPAPSTPPVPTPAPGGPPPNTATPPPPPPPPRQGKPARKRRQSTKAQTIAVAVAIGVGIIVGVAALGNREYCELSPERPRLTCLDGEQMMYRVDLAATGVPVTMKLQDATPDGVHVAAMFLPNVDSGARLYWRPNIDLWIERRTATVQANAMDWESPFHVVGRSTTRVAGNAAFTYRLRSSESDHLYRTTVVNVDGRGYILTVAGSQSARVEEIGSLMARTFRTG